MDSRSRKTAIIATVLAAFVLAWGCGPAEGPPPVELDLVNGQGEIAGEVTATSVILQSRLTAGGGFVDDDLPGAPGVAWFEVSTSPRFDGLTTTGELDATAESDFIVKALVDGLEPGTQYFYRLVYGPDRETVLTGPTRSFSTLSGAGIARETSFVAVTGMNYHQFFRNPTRAYTGPDKDLGYPALATILSMDPDFFVAT